MNRKQAENFIDMLVELMDLRAEEAEDRICEYDRNTREEQIEIKKALVNALIDLSSAYQDWKLYERINGKRNLPDTRICARPVLPRRPQ